MTRRVRITIAPDGSISAEASGAVGEECLRELETIKALLPWATVVDSRLTAGYYGATETATTAQQAFDGEER